MYVCTPSTALAASMDARDVGMGKFENSAACPLCTYGMLVSCSCHATPEMTGSPCHHRTGWSNTRQKHAQQQRVTLQCRRNWRMEIGAASCGPFPSKNNAVPCWCGMRHRIRALGRAQEHRESGLGFTAISDSKVCMSSCTAVVWGWAWGFSSHLFP